MLFGAKGNYLGAVGYGNPVSTDGGVAHIHDSVQPEAGKITEDMAFDLSLVHKRVRSESIRQRHASSIINSDQLRPAKAPTGKRSVFAEECVYRAFSLS